jgi:tyrosyl-tRNA synthetase
MFGKAMSIPDELLSNYLELATDLPEESYRSELNRIESGEVNPRDLKLELATELVRLYHGPDEALQARQFFIDTFSRKTVDREQVAQRPIPLEAFKDGAVSLPLLLASLKFAKSNSAARKLIEAGAVSLEGEKLTDPFASFDCADLEGKLLRVGKHQFAVLIAPDR